MNFSPTPIRLKDGTALTLRAACAADAATLLSLLRQTAEETPFLLREPEEITMTPAEETAFIESRLAHPRALMLVAAREDTVVGLASLMPAGPFFRQRHRCELSIALLRSVWGQGLGRAMMDTLLTVARAAGYEQAELEVDNRNHTARALYQSLGFVEYGRRPRSMKYKDGSTTDDLLMVAPL